MYVKNFVICDRERQYAQNLLQMFGRNKDAGFQFYLFHSMEELKRFLNQKQIDLLLIGEEYSRKQREVIPAKERFVLMKNPQSVLGKEEKGIYRYQSAENIWIQILEETLRKKETPTHAMLKTKGELIGVYSPVHRIGKTKFAMDLGRKLAQKQPVLYLNLEEYAGGTYYFPEKPRHDLADLLYYARQDQGNLGLRISMLVGQDQKLDYILPMQYVQDMQAVKAEEWLHLFEQILEQCIYEKVILDLGDSVAGLFEILKYCGTIYMPYIEEKAAMEKLKQYTENLRKCGLESVLEKTIQRRMSE